MLPTVAPYALPGSVALPGSGKDSKSMSPCACAQKREFKLPWRKAGLL